ncbi:cytochrome P450 [Streptomyces cahuitamycinicus]|uniref:Cytochrome P450 n=1 Tax=Streptomyces cahuitamycinicus TaxID=2070367 RepID=A0A2N8TXU2_9ACTN|nr:cytochrome P450 [Streptomyces cahuitamycinicus]PNG23853.1 cytochrome P450 [Streptomyces cahuitamycinicus]
MTDAPATALRSAGTRLPVSALDPFDRDVLEDPLPLQAALRDAGPLVYLSTHDVYAMARYEQVYAALRDWQSFESGGGVGLSNFRTGKPWRSPSILLEADPPYHDAPRRVLAGLLGPHTQRRLRDKWRAAAADLVDELLAGHTGNSAEFDAVASLAEAFPLRAFPDAVGIPDSGRENLLPFSDFLFNAFGPRNDLVALGAPRARELSAWVNSHCQREALTEDGFGAQIWAAADRGELTPEQAPLVVRSLFAAGVDTTVHGLAALLHALATHPAQWQRLRAEPRLVRVAFDEAVRWASPVQTFFRTATGDIRVAGGVVPAGAKVLLLLGAANRDPRRWDAPDAFDLSRDPSGHLGFGFGLHQCVGQHIARLEAECLLTALAERVETIELAGPTRRRPNNTLRAWDSVPIRVRLAR